jgi:hypothetical protein
MRAQSRQSSVASEDLGTLTTLRPSALRQSSHHNCDDVKPAASSKGVGGSAKLQADSSTKLPKDAKPKKSVKIALPSDEALLGGTRKADVKADALRLLLSSVQDGNSSLDSSLDSRVADSLDSSLSSGHDKKRQTAKRKAAAKSESKMSLRQLSAAHEKLSETIADHKQFRELLLQDW